MSQTFSSADILLPQNTDLEKWSVIACDQFTSDPEYWNKVQTFVANEPSTLNLTLPEIYLNTPDVDRRICAINANMQKYLDSGIFHTYSNAMIYTKRIFSSGKTRTGIIGKLDLEDYSFEPGAQTPIRATEGTIVERIPPRVKIRQDAPLEFPHIMVLIDDPEQTVIEPIQKREEDFETVYDFDLMQNGGHIYGKLLDEREIQRIQSALKQLASAEILQQKYGLSNKDPLVYAVGDGNHSLATAKTCYENLKKKHSPSDLINHPARYALVELVNLHDPGLVFEPLHRVVFQTNPEEIMSELTHYFKDQISFCDTKLPATETDHRFTVLLDGQTHFVSIKNPAHNLTVGTVQEFIDYCLKEIGGSVDYIHEDYAVAKLVAENPESTIGFLLPVPQKSELFKTVIVDGALPRKTFSMGHTEEKRYYLEGRKIKE